MNLENLENPLVDPFFTPIFCSFKPQTLFYKACENTTHPSQFSLNLLEGLVLGRRLIWWAAHINRNILSSRERQHFRRITQHSSLGPNLLEGSEKTSWDALCFHKLQFIGEIKLTVEPQGFVLLAELVRRKLTGFETVPDSLSVMFDHSERGSIINWSYSRSCLTELKSQISLITLFRQITSRELEFETRNDCKLKNHSVLDNLCEG